MVHINQKKDQCQEETRQTETPRLERSVSSESERSKKSKMEGAVDEAVCDIDIVPFLEKCYTICIEQESVVCWNRTYQKLPEFKESAYMVRAKPNFKWVETHKGPKAWGTVVHLVVCAPLKDVIQDSSHNEGMRPHNSNKVLTLLNS